GRALEPFELDEIVGFADTHRPKNRDAVRQKPPGDERRGKLHAVELQCFGDLAHLALRRIVEHAEGHHALGNRFAHRARLLPRETPRGRGEDHPDRTDAELGSGHRVLRTSDAVELDPDPPRVVKAHAPRSSLIFAAGSPDFTSASPTRIASTPIASRSATSLRVEIPLSPTSTTPSGTSGRRRLVAVGSSSKVSRSR